MMDKKAVIVTGGGKGIGLAIARALAQSGYFVVIGEKDADLEAFVRERVPPDALVFVPTDVRDPAQVKNLVYQAVHRTGRLDAVVNNVGVTRFGELDTVELEDWNDLVATNLTSAFLLSKLAAEHFHEHGAIVNISSTRALMSEPGNEAYASTKAGLIGLTHALCNSLHGKVRVNCILPGWIDTSRWHPGEEPARITAREHEQHPAGRVGRPEDIAAIARFLLSEDAGFITGASVIVDGGMTRKMMYM